MAYRGTVRGGMVVLQPGADLPDGLDVTVEPVPVEPRLTGLAPLLISMRNGVPVFPRHGNGAAPDLDLVNKLRDEAQ